MNSLEQLNTFSSSTVDYADEADFSISLLNLGNQSVSGTEGQDHQLPLGITIVDMISGTSTIFYQVDLSTAPSGVTVQWASLPDGVTESTPSSRVSRLTGVSTMAIWDQVKQPNIIVPRDTAGTFSYTVTFNAGVGNVVSWTVSVSLSAQSELNTLTPTSVTYNEDETYTLTSGQKIQIVDSETPSSSFTLTATMSNTNAGVLTSTSPAGLYNFANGVLTLSGDRSDINTFLDGLIFVPSPDFDQNFSVVYVLTNPESLIQTTANQSFNIGITNDELANMDITRTYTQNQYGLLFPTTTPYIIEDVPGALYTATFQLSSDIGIIGLGENLITPANWNELTRTFSFESKTKAEMNTMFQQIKFFPYTDITSTATITYRQSRNGQTTVVETFTLNGTPFTTKITGSSTNTILEDSSIAAQPTNIYPNWSSPGFSVVLQTKQNGNIVSDVGKFNSYTGWNYIGNASVHSGIYKNFTQSSTLSEFQSFISDATSTKVLSLTPDYSSNFDLIRAINYGGTYNGNSFVGGTTYYANSVVTVTGHIDYTLTTSYNYSEDNPVTLVFQSTDLDTRATSYTVSITQNTAGRFVVNGVSQEPGANLVFTDSKTNINSATIQYVPPVDATTTQTLSFTLTKLVDGTTYYQATSVPLTFNNTASHSEYSLTTSYSYNEESITTLVRSILDQDAYATYTMSFTQSVPSQVSVATRGTFWVNGDQLPIGNPVSLIGSRATLNDKVIQYRPPPDFTGSITLLFYLSKTSGGTDTVIANNIPITMTVADQSEYTLGTSYSYAENGIIDLSSLITDNDSTASSYTITIDQTYPDMATYPGQFKVGSNIQTPGSNVSLTGNKGDFNLNPTFRYAVPLDYTGNITLSFTQTKVSGGETFVQANAVPITMTCGQTYPGVSGNISNPVASTQLSWQKIDLTGVFQVDDGSDGFVSSLSWERYYGLRFYAYSGGYQPGNGGGYETSLDGGSVYGHSSPWYNYINYNSKTQTNLNLGNNSQYQLYIVTGESGHTINLKFDFYRDISYPYSITEDANTLARSKIIRTVESTVTIQDPALNSSYQGGLYQGFFDPTVFYGPDIAYGNNNHIILGSEHAAAPISTTLPSTVFSGWQGNPSATVSLKQGWTNTDIYGSPPSTNNIWWDFSAFQAHQWAYNLTTNGYTDWYLPSIAELQWLYTVNPSVFAGSTWWSSSISNKIWFYYMNSDGTRTTASPDSIYSQNHKWIAIRRIQGYK